MESNRREAEMRRRREEQRRIARRRNQKKTEKKRKNHSFLLITMLCLLLAGGFIAAAFTVLFPVKTVVVQGESRYTAQEIIAASRITEGQNLLRLSPLETERAIRQSCPYISDVSLKRKLPSRVIVQVTQATQMLAFPLEEGFLLTTMAMETIEQVSEPENATIVYGISVTATKGGQPVLFADENQQAQLSELLTALEEQQITQITKIDLTDPLSVRLQFGDKHIWKLGDLTNLFYKLSFGLQISNKEGGNGTVDLSGLNNGKNGYFKSEMIDGFMPQDKPITTPTDLETVTSTDVVEDLSSVSE